MAVLVHLDHEALSPPPLQNRSQLYSNLDIEQDPYVAYLRSEDDGKYHQMRKTHKRYCQDQIKRFVRMAIEVNSRLGPWTSEIYICLCIHKFQSLLLATHPVTKDLLRIGTFVGTSNHHARTSNISDLINASGQKETLNDLRNGTKNLIIATSVCEEGMDIAVCNVVICFEPPTSLKSFIQRMGRARSTKSKYVIMFQRAREDTS